jgi:microcystin-dependent protein
MAGEPYIGEIRMFAGNFAPVGWMFCEGQTLPISENDALFTLIGTTYGGDGQETFNLPNLASRVPMHFGTGPDGVNYQLAEAAGTESVTLSTQQIPNHSHPMVASTAAGNNANPGGAVIAQSPASITRLIEDVPSVQMNAQSATPIGGSQPHENCQPFLCINFIISLFGVFPQQT